MSPLALFDEAIQGCPDDVQPSNNGVDHIHATTLFLESKNITCCIVDVPALNYYGAKRVTFDWLICVPCALLEDALRVLGCLDTITAYRPSPMIRSNPFTIDHIYPRFKFVGIRLFFKIMPDLEYYFTCLPSNVEYSPFSHLPFPTAAAFAQALLDGYRLGDLEDFIDGLDLDEDWGEQNLDLDSYTDSTRMKDAAEREGVEDVLLCDRHIKREIWSRHVRAKQKRMGVKYPTHLYATRFRKFGSKDPREKVKEQRKKLSSSTQSYRSTTPAGDPQAFVITVAA